jgi:putative ABC transport system permease protein
MPEIYLPHNQFPVLRMALEMRSSIEPSSLVTAVRRELRAMDPEVPIYNIKTADELVYDTIAARKFALILIGGFAGLALLVASIGIYGVISYVVSRRRQEFGLRMALGATQSNVLQLVVLRGVHIVLIGIATGMLGSIALGRVLKTFLFGVEGYDPATLAAVGIVSVVSALLACVVPALRAIRVDPMIALREE